MTKEITTAETIEANINNSTAPTEYIERLNDTIRQRFSRMVRKSLSFSKKEYMLTNVSFGCFLNKY